MDHVLPFWLPTILLFCELAQSFFGKAAPVE